MSARDKAAGHAARTVYGALALALPGFIIFGRGALGVALGIAVLALIAATAFGVRWRLWDIPLKRVLAVVGLLVLAWLPATVGSVLPDQSVMTVLRTAVMIAAGAVLVVFAGRDERDWALRMFIAGMLVAQLFAVAALYITPDIAFFRGRNGVVFPHYALKASASSIACALPVLVYAGWRLRGWWMWGAALCLPLGLAVMYGTFSRSSLAGMIAAVAFCGIVFVTRRRPLAHLLVGLVLAAVVAVAGIAMVLRGTPDLSRGGYALFAPVWLVDQHRQVIWQFTLDRFQERPWFGWGPNAITAAPGADDMIPELNGEFIPAHPHNWAIETLAETGLAGFLPLLATIVGVAAAATCAYLRTGDPATLAWLALWLTYWSAGAFNFSMWNATWQSSGMVLAALVCSRQQRSATP